MIDPLQKTRFVNFTIRKVCKSDIFKDFSEWIHYLR